MSPKKYGDPTIYTYLHRSTLNLFVGSFFYIVFFKPVADPTKVAGRGYPSDDCDDPPGLPGQSKAWRCWRDRELRRKKGDR